VADATAPPWDRAADLTYRTRDHPIANGREPVRGETGWNMRFVLEDGRYLEVQLGPGVLTAMHGYLDRIALARALEVTNGV
jgi:hypothetical protein